VRPRPGGPLVSRSGLILLLALVGVILAAEMRVVVARYGMPAYLTLIAMVAVGLVATVARPRPRP
jgi:hypothetical protein